MQTTETAVPDQIDYDATDEQRMSWSPALKEGLFKTVVAKVEKCVAGGGTAPTNNLQLSLTLAPLDANDTPQTPTAHYWVDLPIKNPLIAGHTPSPSDKVKKRFRRFVQAIDPSSLPAGPRKENDVFVSADGQPMTKEMWDTYNTTCNKIALEKAKLWFNNPETLKGAVCYTYIKRNEQYSNVFYVASNPGDKPVVTEGFAG